MNDFYTRLFFIACRETKISPTDISNRNAIINQAINKLSEKDEAFITMLKPIYLETDPNGKYSMSYNRKTCDAFRMNKNEVRKYKHEVKHKLIEIMKSILTK